MSFGTKGCVYNCGNSCTGECIKPLKQGEGILKQIEGSNIKTWEELKEEVSNMSYEEIEKRMWEQGKNAYRGGLHFGPMSLENAEKLNDLIKQINKDE
tara:strand:+ start:1425 stop:1718 length:294 start_codon:yes stop_codon:yes gene_type:complete